MDEYSSINKSSRKRCCTKGCNTIFFIIILIFQIILIFFQIFYDDYIEKEEYKYWNKNLISEINVKKTGYVQQKFDELDSSKPINFYYSDNPEVYIWNNHSFYAYRRSKEYNYIKLRTLKDEEKDIKTKICGKDFYGNDLYFPIYEKCPINFIEISNSPISSLPSNYNIKTKQLDNKYLHYSNDYIEGYPFYGFEIVNNDISCNVYSQRFPSLNSEQCSNEEVIPYDKTLIDIQEKNTLIDQNIIKEQKNEDYVKLFSAIYGENFNEVSNDDTKKKLKVFKYYLYYYTCLLAGIVFSLLFIILIAIMLICYCCKQQRHGQLGISLFYLYLFFMISYIPLFIVKINVDYQTQYKFVNFLHFVILFLPIIILIFNLCNVKKKRCKNFCKAFVVFLLVFYLIFSIIINGIYLYNRKLDKGRFEDFYNTFTKTPIIEIEGISYVDFNLGKIVYSDNIDSKSNEIELYSWEGMKFKITRATDQYTYADMLKNKNDRKKCGVDSVGNPLYLPIDVICPINYIEISNNELPPQNGKIFKTMHLGSNKHLHYSNEYTDNPIIFDFKISDEIPPYSSTNSYNALCFSIYIHGYKYCNFGQNYYDYQGISGYSLIDKEELSTLISDNDLPDTHDFTFDNNEYAYLYKRTYSAVDLNKEIKKTKIYDFNFWSTLISVVYSILLIFFTIFFIVGIYKLTNFVLVLSLILIFLCFFLELINMLLYRYTKKNFFSISFLDIAKMNKNYPLFYKIDFAFMIIDSILFLINLIILICNKNVEGLEGIEEIKNESESDEDQIIVMEKEEENERLRRENEIAEQEKRTMRSENQNIQKLIMRQQTEIKNLEEKTRWDEQQKKQNEQIQFDLNNQVKNLRISLESKNRELERKDNDLQSQSEQYLVLQNKLRDTISEYNAQIRGLESDKNKLQEEKDDLFNERNRIIDERAKAQDEINRLRENTGGNDEENQKKIKDMEKTINELNRNYGIITEKLKEQKNKLNEKDKELEIIKEEKIKVENERDEIAKEKELIEKQYNESMEEKDNIMKEIEELRKSNNKENNERLRQLEKLQKELNNRIRVLQDLVKKNTDPKVVLQLTIKNIKDCIKDEDYLGRTKEEMENKIEEIENWLSDNQYASEKEYRDKLSELKYFLQEEKNR